MTIEITSSLAVTLQSIPNLAQIADLARPESPALGSAYEALVQPLLSLLEQCESSPELSVQLVDPGTMAYQQATMLVNYSYSKRFSQRDEFLQFEDPASNSALVVVSLDCATRSIVFATVRVTWGSTVDVFELFDLPGGWHNGLNADEFGSIGRFALHPIVDAIFEARKRIGIHHFGKIDACRAELFRMVMSYGFEELHQNGIKTIYAITHPALQTWFTICGLQSQLVQAAQPSENDTFRRLKELYPHYWDNQPAVYLLKGMTTSDAN